MRKTLTTLALAGAVGLTGVAGAALVVPAVSYAATGDSTALEDRVASIGEALTGLVSDGTLTQAQADEVASTLADRGPLGGRQGHGGLGGVGRALAPALEELGITAEELRAAAEAGTTLGALAEANDVSRDELVTTLVEAAQTRLDEAVADGRLTQAEADEKVAGLEDRITASLDEPVRLGRGHHGGPGRYSHDDDADEGTAPPQTPSTTPSQSGDA